MKTIEERAKHSAHMDVPMPQDMMTTKWQQGKYEGYIQGATDQKAIDIDKACSIIESLNWDISAETGKMINVDAFRKAMED